MSDAPTPNQASSAASRLTPRSILSRLGPTSILAAGACVLPPLGSIVLFAYMNIVGQWLRGHEDAGVALYILGFTILAGCALLPTYASAILGGWAFGMQTGFPAALAGFLGASLLAYIVARTVAGDRVVGLIDERPAWKAVRLALVGSGFWRTLAIVALVRLPFSSPFALCNLVLASVKVGPAVYALGTLLGMAPRTGIVVWLAVQLRDAMAEDAAAARSPWWYFVAGAIGAVVVLMILSAVAKRAVRHVTKNNMNPATPPAPSP